MALQGPGRYATACACWRHGARLQQACCLQPRRLYARACPVCLTDLKIRPENQVGAHAISLYCYQFLQSAVYESAFPPTQHDGADDPRHGQLLRQCARGRHSEKTGRSGLRLRQPLCRTLLRHAERGPGHVPAAYPCGRAGDLSGQRELHRYVFHGNWHQGDCRRHSRSGRAPCEQLLFHHGGGGR